MRSASAKVISASAGDHFQAPGHTGAPASGDLPSLLVRSDGAGKLVATSDGFTEDQLKGPDGSAIMLHQGSRHGLPRVPPPSSASRAAYSARRAPPVHPSRQRRRHRPSPRPQPPQFHLATATETTSSAPAASSSSVAPSTSTSTVTVIQPPTIPEITVPHAARRGLMAVDPRGPLRRRFRRFRPRCASGRPAARRPHRRGRLRHRG